MEKFIDLHVHSTASDGTLTPSRLVSLAEEKKLKAFALTDHDTIAGLEEALLAAKTSSVEVIPGIELSTTWLGRDVHIVGLDIDYSNYYFQEALSRFQDSREVRNEKIMSLLQKEGISITRDSMAEAFPESVWTRAHFARYLLEHKYVGSINEAFDRYLGDHAKCYVPREKVTPFQAISLIHEGGGIAVFAHPILCRLDKDRLESLAAQMKQAGLDGIEAITPKPQGDVTLEEVKEALGDQVDLVDGIAAILFDETYPLEMLKEQTEKVIDLFAGHLILGISDEMSSTGNIDRIKYVGEIVDKHNLSC